MCIRDSFYKAKPGKLIEAAELMREGRDIGLANDQLVIVHQQNIGKGAEKMFLWVDFFNTYEDRAKAYTAEAWTPYLEKFNRQEILEPVRSYQMTSLDDIDPGDYIVQVWIWDPKKGKTTETLEAFGHTEKVSKKILIVGGGNIGFNLAKNIEETLDAARIKIVEKDKERAEFLASELNNTIVINGNGLDEEVLAEANLEEAETVLALTNDDEDNSVSYTHLTLPTICSV